MKPVKTLKGNRSEFSLICALVVGIALLYSADFVSAQNPAPVKGENPAARLSSRAQNLVNKSWSDSSFAQGIEVISERNETKESRAVAMEVLHANRRKLNRAEMGRFLAEVTSVAKDTAADEALSALAVRTMGNLALTMEELGQISPAEAKKEARFLMEAATNSQRSIHFQASAINSLGILKIAEASPLLHGMLGERASMNVPEISRPACLSLMRIEGERAVPTLADVLRKTTDSRVFGTAAFALGQIKNSESMVALVENLERFPDSGSCDASLVGMEEVISNVLKSPDDPNLIYAVRATRHQWRDGQRERYVPLLRRLLTTAPKEVRKVSLDRLLEEASKLELEHEKQELAPILEAIINQPELGEYHERIRRRLSATVLTPVAGDSVPVPTVREGGNPNE